MRSESPVIIVQLHSNPEASINLSYRNLIFFIIIFITNFLVIFSNFDLINFWFLNFIDLFDTMFYANMTLRLKTMTSDVPKNWKSSYIACNVKFQRSNICVFQRPELIVEHWNRENHELRNALFAQRDLRCNDF